ncbi:hypothetical protein M6C35_002033 [Vibrio metschnikovii]|nr:hypothetical protein [Vibrio metschnikovii]
MGTNRSDLGYTLRKALDLFVELTGVDPSKSSFIFSGYGGISDYNISSMYKSIDEALRLDPTNVTAFFLLEDYSAQYLNGKSFTVTQLLNEPKETRAYLDKVLEFKKLVLDPDVTGIRDSFHLNMRMALRHYGYNEEKLSKFIDNNSGGLALLRRDALRSIDKLRVDQFLIGDAESKNVKPAYLGTINQFWNINTLLEVACSSPSGIALSLIRNPIEFESYFAFSVRNGGNVYTVSDVPIGKHPLSAQMSRKPERRFDERVSKNWFPYDLLDIAYSEDEERMYVDRSKKTRLAPKQQEFVGVRKVKDLEPEEAIWTVMMFELIAEKFWEEGFSMPELSYTGEMLIEESILLDKANKLKLPTFGYQPLSLPPMSINDIKAESVTTEQIGSFGGSPLSWMEKRYIEKIPFEVLNQVANDGSLKYLPPISAEKHKLEDGALVCLSSGIVTTTKQEEEKLPFWEKEGRTYLQSFRPTTLGTKSEIEADRKWLARHRVANAIQREARIEFDERKDDIQRWWKDSLSKNINELYAMAVNDEYWVTVSEEMRDETTLLEGTSLCDGSMHRIMLKKMISSETRIFSSGRVILGGDEFKNCHYNNAKASWLVQFQPKTAHDLALLAGCGLDELPDILRSWRACSQYLGNAILNRIDPMAWVLRDPWSGDTFLTSVLLSKSAMNQFKKQYPQVDTRPSDDKPSSHKTIIKL